LTDRHHWNAQAARYSTSARIQPDIESLLRQVVTKTSSQRSRILASIREENGNTSDMQAFNLPDSPMDTDKDPRQRV
jgi:hypothetical protein